MYDVILYMGLEHPWILVSAGAPETNPWHILRDNCIYIHTILENYLQRYGIAFFYFLFDFTGN